MSESRNHVPTVAELLASPEAYQQRIMESVFGADLTAMSAKKASKPSNTQSVKKASKSEGLTADQWKQVESDSRAILDQLFGSYSDLIRK